MTQFGGCLGISYRCHACRGILTAECLVGDANRIIGVTVFQFFTFLLSHRLEHCSITKQDEKLSFQDR